MTDSDDNSVQFSRQAGMSSMSIMSIYVDPSLWSLSSFCLVAQQSRWPCLSFLSLVRWLLSLIDPSVRSFVVLPALPLSGSLVGSFFFISLFTFWLDVCTELGLVLFWFSLSFFFGWLWLVGWIGGYGSCTPDIIDSQSWSPHFWLVKIPETSILIFLREKKSENSIPSWYRSLYFQATNTYSLFSSLFYSVVFWRARERWWTPVCCRRRRYNGLKSFSVHSQHKLFLRMRGELG